MEMNDIVDFHNLYEVGKYKECSIVLAGMLEALKREQDTKIPSDKTQDVWNCILSNNLLIVESLDAISNNCSEKTWNEYFHRFINLYELYKNMINDYERSHFPPQLIINLLYNAIYWYWLGREVYHLTCGELRKRTMFQTIRRCLIKFLEASGGSYIDFNTEHISDNNEDILHLIRKISNQLMIKFKNLLRLQLIDLIHLIILLINTEDQLINKTEKTYFSSGTDYADLFRNLFFENSEFSEFTWRSYDNKIPRIVVSSQWDYFKFGFERMNSKLHLIFSKSVASAFALTASALYISDNDETREASQFLSKYEKMKCNDFPFVYRYLSACNFLKSKKYAEGVEFAKKASVTYRSDHTATYEAHILAGRLYIMCGKYDEALQLFHNASISKYSSLKRIAMYYASEANKQMENSVGEIVCLQRLLQSFKTTDSDDIENDFNARVMEAYQRSILKIVHPRNEITLQAAHYLYAKTNLLNENFQDACTTYHELLNLLENNGEDYTDASIVNIPNTPRIFHEGIIAYCRAGRKNEAKSLSRNAIEKYVPLYYSSQRLTTSEDVSKLLGSLEEDVISLILLSYLSDVDSERNLLRELLNRGSKAISEYLDRMRRRLKKSKTNDSETSLDVFICNQLLSKIFLHKSHLSYHRGEKDEAIKLLQKSLEVNPGDRDTIEAYRMIDAQFVESDTSHNISMLDAKNKCFLEMDYVLKYLKNLKSPFSENFEEMNWFDGEDFVSTCFD